MEFGADSLCRDRGGAGLGLVSALIPGAQAFHGQAVLEQTSGKRLVHTFSSAAHGDFGDSSGVRQAEIVIDADNNVWFDAVKMLVLNVRPALAVFANCLAGRIHENVDGEPLGLVSLQMMRGTRQVLACLAPVPDFFTPPLIGLFWQAYRGAPDVRAAL